MRYHRGTLNKEYDYQTSDAAVKESIEANDYEFEATGQLH